MRILYRNPMEERTRNKKIVTIYQYYRQMMYGAACNILKDPYEAEDTMHNAFLRILDHLDKINLEDKSRTKQFILIITENAATDIYRKRKHAHLISSEELTSYVTDFRENTVDGK